MDVDFEGVDPAGELRRTYLDEAATLLVEGDEVLETARSNWATFVAETAGNAVDDLTLDRPFPDRPLDAVDRAFLATAYYDFLVDSLLDAVEGIWDFELQNRDPAANTAGLDVAFTDLHDHVLPPEAGRARLVDAVTERTVEALDPDALGELYRAVMPRPVRLALGEYYTPRGIADLAIDAVDGGRPGRRLLDPGCGAGAFLTAAIEAKRAHVDSDPTRAVDAITDSVVGIDLNPVAVKSAKLSYLLALADLLRDSTHSSISVPVFLTDALGLTRTDEIDFRGSRADMEFDALVGNPPWIPWERVPSRLKDAWRSEYVSELGLQPHDGIEARLGHSNDDVSVPYAFTCIHRYLRAGGAAAFVLKRDIVRGPAGAVLRRAKVGDRPVRIDRVHDFARLDPFADASADASLYVFTADEAPTVRVPTTVWRPRDESGVSFASAGRLRATAASEDTSLVPVDGDDRTTAWVRADLARDALGECAHQIRHGLKDDAAAVFGLDRADLSSLEPERIYPYLRSRHVRKWGLSGHDLRLVPADQAGEDNEAWLREACPSTYAYLDRHRETLLGRSSSWLDSGPFYTQFGLGPYTWAPYKVVWCRLGFKPDFAVASTRTDPALGEKPVIPGDHYMFVATDDRREAHFLCALLNSKPYQRTLRTLASGGKASLSKSVVSELALPAFPATDRAETLADCSLALHEHVSRHADGSASSESEGAVDATESGDDRRFEARMERIQARIDRTVAAGIECGEFGTNGGAGD